MVPATTRQHRAALLAAALLLPALAVSAAAASGAPAPAKPASQVYLVQGVPGGPADVSVDGTEVVSALEPTGVHGPIDLAPGEHTVLFEGDGWSVESPVTLRPGSEDVVVHLPADPAADPVVTVFANNVGAVREGEGRIMVAHTAVVPPADIRVEGDVLFANVANGEFVGAEVPAATYAVDVVPTGGDKPLLGPVDLEVAAGALTRVFAIGQPKDGSMTAVVQVIPLDEISARPPLTVGAGAVGLADPRARPTPELWSAALAAVLMGALLLALTRRRHVRS
jgi:hypothetical protein